MASPYPKPTALRVIEGDQSKGRLKTRLAHEVKPDPLCPRDAVRVCPDHLMGDERRWFRHFFRMFASTPRMITVLDVPLIAMLAKEWTDMLNDQATLRKTGPIFVYKKKRKTGKDENGNPIFEESSYPQVFPLVNVEAGRKACVIKLLCQLGGSPVARTKVDTIGPSATDAIEDALA